MTHSAENDGALLQAVFEATVDAIVVADEQGVIIRANPAAQKMFGFAPDEMQGRNVRILMPDEIADAHAGHMRRYLETGEAHVIGIGRAVEGRRKNGEVFPLHLSIGEMKRPDGSHFVAILHDVSERVAAQAALARSQRLDALGQMTGGISHDFNNLLTVIIGNLELLEIRGGDGGDPLLKDALEAAELGANLTSRLMQFARKGSLTPEETNINDACEAALAMLRRTLGAEIMLEVEFADNLPRIYVDVAQLQTALLNLALNARDAMQRGGTLTIRSDLVEIDDKYVAQETDIALGEYVRLSVTDTGEGMDRETRAQAFEPFFTTKSASSGTGLGLAMVHGFMRQSEGHVTVYSERGHGTSFALYFPVQPESRPAPRPVALPVSADLRGQGEVILVVEDDDMVRSLSAMRLRELGYMPVMALDGVEAFDMLDKGIEVDLVFTDLVMPGGLNGHDLAQRIAMKFPELPVVLTSGYSDDVMSESTAEGGGYPILRKPYRQAELARIMRAALDR